MKGRSEGVVQRVLDAGVAELARSGYSDFRTDNVAARAKVNKTTVYRRWPTRAALITSVVERLAAPLRTTPLPDTGSLENDLIQAFGRRFAVGREVEGRAWARLLEERHRPEVRRLIGATVDRRRAEWRAMIARGVTRKEIPAGTDLEVVLDFVRALVDAQRRSVDELAAGRLRMAVATVIAGARARTLMRR